MFPESQFCTLAENPVLSLFNFPSLPLWSNLLTILCNDWKIIFQNIRLLKKSSQSFMVKIYKFKLKSVFIFSYLKGIFQKCLIYIYLFLYKSQYSHDNVLIIIPYNNYFSSCIMHPHIKPSSKVKSWKHDVFYRNLLRIICTNSFSIENCIIKIRNFSVNSLISLQCLKVFNTSLKF